MSVELGKQNIRVNAVAPATVDTPMIRAVTGDGRSGYKSSGASPLGTVATPEDIVPVIKFLLTPGSNYINGTMLTVDGGTSAAFAPAAST
jgi:NAD(P)-dependent dehydrogenase (short-subunit alcohol dehydrogenase family)